MHLNPNNTRVDNQHLASISCHLAKRFVEPSERKVVAAYREAQIKGKLVRLSGGARTCWVRKLTQQSL